MKKCTKCGKSKRNSGFAARNASDDLYQWWCKVCYNEYAREYRIKKRLAAVARVQPTSSKVDNDVEARGAYVGLDMRSIHASAAYQAMMELCEQRERKKP